MLKLRPAIVVEIDHADAGLTGSAEGRAGDVGEQQLTVELSTEDGAGSRRPAIADVGLVGRAEVGDEVIVNVQALDLGLGSGGFDVVHVNLTRGLDSDGLVGANVMKLNYTSLQHTISPVEDERLQLQARGDEDALGRDLGRAQPGRARKLRTAVSMRRSRSG